MARVWALPICAPWRSLAVTSRICGCTERLGACLTATRARASRCSRCPLGVPALRWLGPLEGVAGKILRDCAPIITRLVPTKAAAIVSAAARRAYTVDTCSTVPGPAAASMAPSTRSGRVCPMSARFHPK
eukprot:2430558-Pyramimonas_sp.AAC.1